MQTANIMVALAGDRGNTVPRYGVTAAEIAVLRAIHGEDAVHDVDPIDGGVRRSNRDELRRLKETYMAGGKTHPAVEALYPGAAARVFENIEELELPDEAFKPTGRARAPAPAEPAELPADAVPEPEDERDGIDEMPDRNKLFD
jgi:hypothetical protein